MKTFVIVITNLFCCVSLLAETFAFRYNETDIILAEEKEGIIVLSKNSNYDIAERDEILQPGLLWQFVNVLVPYGYQFDSLSYNVDSVQLLSRGTYIYQSLRVLPTGMSQEDDSEYEVVPYPQDKYPTENVSVSMIYEIGGYKIISLRLCPLIYYTGPMDLYLSSKIEVDLCYSEMNNPTPSNPTKTQTDMVSRTIINPEIIATYPSESTNLIQVRTSSPNTSPYIKDGHLYITAPDGTVYDAVGGKVVVR